MDCLNSNAEERVAMKFVRPSLLLLACALGCGGEEKPADLPPEKIEAIREQYIKQAKAFNAEPAAAPKK